MPRDGNSSPDEFFTVEQAHCEVGIARAKARARALLPPGALLDQILAELDTFVIVRATDEDDGAPAVKCTGAATAT